MYRIKFEYLEDGQLKVGDYGTCFSEEMKNYIFNILKKYDDITKIWWEDEKGNRGE